MLRERLFALFFLKVSEPIIVNGVQCTVEIVMHEKLRRFVSDCAASTVGRFVFVGYLVYVVSMIGYAYAHLPDITYPFRFYGERELFEFLNWPQLELIRSSRFMYRWQASKVTDSLLAVYVALPWWIYGHVFELIVKRIADSTPRQSIADKEPGTFFRHEPNWLDRENILESIRISGAKERLK